MSHRVVVIGGGIAGLATAGLLARDGHEVTLLERTGVLGGRAGSWESDGFRFDTGPSWYLMPEVFDHFFALMGTSTAEQLDLVRLDPGYRVYFEGKREPLDVPANRPGAVALFDSVEPGAGAKLERYLDSAADTYEMAKERFLYTSFQSFARLLSRDVVKRLPRLLNLLATPLNSYVAKRFTDPRLRQILGYPAVFLGSSPYATPSLYHLMSHLDLTDGVLYPRGGFVTLIRAATALAERSGVTIRTDSRVTAIVTEAGERGRRPRVHGVRYRDAAGDEQTIPADVVVGAADLHHIETTLLPPALQTYPEKYWDKKVPGPGAVLIYLGIRGELPQLSHHTLLFASDWKANFDSIFEAPTSVPNPASMYLCKPSATDPTVAPPGHENLFVLVPIPADPSLGAGGVNGEGDAYIEEIADTAIAQIATWAAIPDLADRIVLRRTVGPGDFADGLNSWQGSALGPAHTLGQSAFFRSGNISRTVDGLLYAGSSTLPGVGLPMCLISAELVVKRLRGDLSTGALPEPVRERSL